MRRDVAANQKDSEVMKRIALSAVVVAASFLSACSPAREASGPLLIRPGAPGESSRVLTSAEVARVGTPRHTSADVDFMRGMIAHHLQAIEMVSLVEGRSHRRDIGLLARRIELSQDDELRLMEGWLEARGEAPPASADHAHGAHAHHAGMAGMLTPDELSAMAAASGDDFDRLFLAFMIRHHEGALTMVDELFAIEGGGQEPEIFQFASHVVSDQRLEIERMQGMLDSLQ
jgi:uncharacterized protein (DUF305 family)